MKIKQYQLLYEMLESDIPELDKAYHFYAIMKGQEYNDDLPISKVLDYYQNKQVNLNTSGFIPYYRIGWKLYRLNLNITHNSASDNMAIIAFCANKNELMANLHKVLATMTKRTQAQRKDAKYFDWLSNKIKENISVNVAYSAAIFFLKHYSHTEILKRLTTQMQKVNKKLEALKK